MRYVADDGKAVAILMDLCSCRQNTLVAAIERLHKIIEVEDIFYIFLHIIFKILGPGNTFESLGKFKQTLEQNRTLALFNPNHFLEI